jgi:hypothetical protein
MARYIFLFLVLFSCSCNYVEEYFPSTSDKKKNIVELYVEDQGRIIAGIYDNAIVAVSDSQFIALYNVDNNPKNCSFYLHGIIKDHIDTVFVQWRTTKNDLRGRGHLLISDKNNLILKLEAEKFNSCSKELFATGIKLKPLKKYNWKSFRLIKEKSSMVFEEPIEEMPSIGKFKNKELVCVLEEKSNWLRVENMKTKSTLGWIQKNDSEELFPLEPSRN